MLVENYRSDFRKSSEIQRAKKVLSNDFFNFQVDLCGPKAVFQADLTKGNVLKKKVSHYISGPKCFLCSLVHAIFK